MNHPFLHRWWPLAAVAVLLAVTALAATHSAPTLRDLNPPAEDAPTLETPQARPPGRPAPPGEVVGGLPSWLGTAVLVALLAVLAGVVLLVVWTLVRDRLRRRVGTARPAVPGPGQASADEVVAALDAGLEDLSDNDRDPRRAIIACWVRLEQAAAAAGTSRQPGDAPADLVGRLLREQRVSGEVLAGFAEVYREARYATTHTVDDRMRAEARAALQRLRADLTVRTGS
ncbi:MAG TPA: DUF4129 domain-containing protein [Catenuloplanes sp.]|jgi:hypothetical protein